MKRRKTSMKSAACRLAILVSSLLFLQAASADKAVEPNANGIIEFVDKADGGKPVSVRITLRHPNATDKTEDNDWWGAFDKVPDRIISKVEIKVGSEAVELFRSAYADLGDVRQVDIKNARDHFTLIIHGGETGTGYTAELLFKDGYMVSRQVTHNEMGLEEKTEYFPVRDN